MCMYIGLDSRGRAATTERRWLKICGVWCYSNRLLLLGTREHVAALGSFWMLLLLIASVVPRLCSFEVFHLLNRSILSRSCDEFSSPDTCCVSLTTAVPAVLMCSCLKGSVPYWSNPPFLIFNIRALWRSVLSARAPECQKLKTVGQTSMAKCKALTGSAVKGLIRTWTTPPFASTSQRAVMLCGGNKGRYGSCVGGR